MTFYLYTLLSNGREDVTLPALFPPDCSGSLTVASKTRLRCSDALASARHPQNYYLQGCEPGWIIFAIEERSYKLSLRGMTREKLLSVQFPTRRQCILSSCSKSVRSRSWVIPKNTIKVWNADLARNVAQAGCWRAGAKPKERSNGNSDRDGPEWRYPASFRRD